MYAERLGDKTPACSGTQCALGLGERMGKAEAAFQSVQSEVRALSCGSISRALTLSMSGKGCTLTQGIHASTKSCAQEHFKCPRISSRAIGNEWKQQESTSAFPACDPSGWSNCTSENLGDRSASFSAGRGQKSAWQMRTSSSSNKACSLSVASAPFLSHAAYMRRHRCASFHALINASNKTNP